MSQKDQLAWERIASVIEWSGMTINHFAKHIGISRSERLYQIQRGNNGISRKMAELIVAAFPQINILWLTTGRDEMFVRTPASNTHVDLYDIDVERFDGKMEGLEPNFRMVIPTEVEADFAMKYCGLAMSNTITPNSIVMLKEVTRESIIPGSEYLVVSENFTSLRIIRRGEGVWRLVASQSEQYDDIFVSEEQIIYIYKVTAKLIINKI